MKKNINPIIKTLISIFLLLSLSSCENIFSKLEPLESANSNSSDILNAYNISTLYSNSNNYNAIELSNDISIIGLIEIPSINISYPILSKSNEELLKISVCRFARSNA